MAGTVYALLVGINDYRPPVTPLYGCRNDLHNVDRFLRARIGDRYVPQTLLDEDATRANVIDAFRAHLGRAGEGDVALFVFNGHGTEEPAPPELGALEPSGRLQVLMCADSGRRVEGRLLRGIADKELALLIREVAARDPHVTVFLDCCHSGSGTRDPRGAIRQWLPVADVASPSDRDLVRELANPRPLDSFLVGSIGDWAGLPRVVQRDATDSGGNEAADHVALAACESFQVAKEQTFGPDVTGVFTRAALTAMETLGPSATYRELTAAIRSRVEQSAAEQTPVLYPRVPGSKGDGLVLDGTLRRSSPQFLVTGRDGAYEVDAGLVHGLRSSAAGEAFELMCTTLAGEASGRMTVTEVGIGRARLEPIGWTPTEEVYRAVVAAVPLPSAVVSVETCGPTAKASDDALRRLAADVIATCGPGGKPSPHIRSGELTEDPDAPHVRLAVHAQAPTSATDARPRIRVLRADATPLVPDVPGVDEAAFRRAAAIAEHVAKWEQLRRLDVPGSGLADVIRVDLVPAEIGETSAPDNRPPLPFAGGYELAYALDGSGYVPPRVWIRLTNINDAPLYVALIDLTDRFACRTGLYTTERLVGGHAVLVANGTPVPVRLPADRAVEPGALVRDWLKLLVSEADFDASSFELNALDEPPNRTVQGGPTSTLALLARRAMSRDVGANGATERAAEWAARTIPIVTRIPT